MLKRNFMMTSIGVVASITAPVALSSDTTSTPSDLVTLTNKCDSTCKKIIKKDLKVSAKYQMREGLLLEINGKQGTRKVRNGLAYDSAFHGGFTTQVKSGSTELVIDHNSQFVQGKPARFKVDLLGGHKYVVGRIRVERIPSVYYEWFPVVYDATSQKIVYGSEDLIQTDDAE